MLTRFLVRIRTKTWARTRARARRPLNHNVFYFLFICFFLFLFLFTYPYWSNLQSDMLPNSRALSYKPWRHLLWNYNEPKKRESKEIKLADQHLSNIKQITYLHGERRSFFSLIKIWPSLAWDIVVHIFPNPNFSFTLTFLSVSLQAVFEHL